MPRFTQRKRAVLFDLASDIIGLSAVAAITYGTWQISHAWAWIVGGTLVLCSVIVGTILGAIS